LGFGFSGGGFLGALQVTPVDDNLAWNGRIGSLADNLTASEGLGKQQCP
jgi:hypothetical protein